MAMVMGPATTTRLTPMVMAAVTAIQLPDFITPVFDATSPLACVSHDHRRCFDFRVQRARRAQQSTLY